MEKIQFNDQDAALHDFLVNNIESGKTALALALMETNALAHPSKEVFLSSLYSLATAQDDPNAPYNPNPYSPFPYGKVDSKPPNEDQRFFIEMIKKLRVSVEDLSSTHPTTTSFILKKSGQGALIEALAHSSKSQVKKWLSFVMPGSSTGHRGDNKSSVVGLLIYTKAYDVINAIAEVVPDWGQILDHRNRNALFYCSTREDVDLALLGKADPKQLDKSSRDLSTWWNAARNSEVSSVLISHLSEVGSKGAPTVEDAMVNKFMRLGIECFDDQERQAFDLAAQDPSWRWEGMLKGIKHKWTLEEIWKFGELSVISGDSEPLTPDNRHPFYFVKDPRYKSKELPDFLDGVRGALPEELRKKWYGRNANEEKTSLTLALDFLSLVAHRDTSPPPSSLGFLRRSGNLTASQLASIYGKMSRSALRDMDDKTQGRVIEGLSLLRDCKWAFDDRILFPVLEQISGRVARENICIDRHAWGQYYLGLPQKAALHHSAFNSQMLSLFSKPLLLESKADNALTAQIQIKVLGLLPPEDKSTHFSNNHHSFRMLDQLVEGGALEGLSIHSRWLRNLDPHTRSLVGRALLMNKVKQEEHDKTKEDATHTPRVPMM